MKPALLLILLIGSCYSWRQMHRIDGWQYTPQYTDNCADTATMLFEGAFTNENKYMQNPLCNCSDSTGKFTVINVTINDTITIHEDSLQSSAFEIPLKEYGLHLNDRVVIKVKYRVSHPPRMLNPLVR